MSDDGEDLAETVVIRLSLPDALVLDAMFWRWEESGMQSVLSLEHKAEIAAIWSLQVEFERELEPHLVTVFDPPYDGQYVSKLENARKTLGESVADWTDLESPKKRSWNSKLFSRQQQ